MINYPFPIHCAAVVFKLNLNSQILSVIQKRNSQLIGVLDIKHVKKSSRREKHICHKAYYSSLGKRHCGSFRVEHEVAK